VGFVAFTHLGVVQRLFFTDPPARDFMSIAALDYINGGLFAIVPYVILHDQSRLRGRAYAGATRELAGFSYTLYVVHIPVLIFLRAAWLPYEPWPATPGYLALGVLLAAAVAVYAYGISRVTESRTGAVRDWLMRALKLRTRPADLTDRPGSRGPAAR
jgi:peptidoglycan/LPS O-acetylase OafA/YrhL